MAHGTLARSSPPSPGGVFHAPSTRAGRLALRLATGGIAAIALSALLVNAAGLPSALGVVAALGLAAIVAAGVLALVAITRRGERSALVLVTALAGLVGAFFVIGELAVPH